MNLVALEDRLAELVSAPDSDSFIFDFLLAYEQPKASITRLKRGSLNKAAIDGQLLWKNKIFFCLTEDEDVHVQIDAANHDKNIKKLSPRFLIVTDMTTFVATDTRTGDTLDISLEELPKHADFFLPLAGLEKTTLASEPIADIRAAEKLAKLYEVIVTINDTDSDDDRHSTNIFLSRILFCLFADDTGIFKKDLFTNSISSHTSEDGATLTDYLERLFESLDLKDKEHLPSFLKEFPYVGGRLFSERLAVPNLNRKCRDLLIACGSLDWAQINPDIFGSMIQAVMHSDHRGDVGAHYTSVTNIKKVIDPLFLNEMRRELESSRGKKTRLKDLLARIYAVNVFDPACGSGNFLIIAYKELCRLEIDIFKELQLLQGGQKQFRYLSNVRPEQFYGIEQEDFAHETAKLGLWLAEHQMNLEFTNTFSDARPTLPLGLSGNIVCANALQQDWESVCPRDKDTEIFIVGNPPYKGARTQTTEQKADLARLFDNHKDFKDADYICGWFLKAGRYLIEKSERCAFVSTNSICQGEQVHILWTRLLQDVEISFAHKPFKWTNSAKHNAGVTCIVIGLQVRQNGQKHLIDDGHQRLVNEISPYLHEGPPIIVRPTKEPPDQLQKMIWGNQPRDGGNLILTDQEKNEIVSSTPESKAFLKRYYGVDEFLNGKIRWCLWIEDESLEEARSIPAIRKRIEAVRKFRLESSAKTTNQYATTPYKFAQRNFKNGDVMIIPIHSSEKRKYIPFGYLSEQNIASNAVNVIYNSQPYSFAVMTSAMHAVWYRRIGGALEERIRYSASISYNTFPFPRVTDTQKSLLRASAFRIIDTREQYSEKTLSQLYDSEKMPADLEAAHLENDILVDQIYRPSQPFIDDDERLNFLLELYNQNQKLGEKSA